MADRVVLMRSCDEGKHQACPGWLPDMECADPEEPTEVICNCGCHDFPAPAVRAFSGGAVIPF